MPINTESLAHAIDTYDIAVGTRNALQDLSDYLEKYVHKLERRENELKHKVARYKKSGKDVEALKFSMHDFGITSAQINAALKLRKEFLERLIESAKDVNSAGENFIKTFQQNTGQTTD